MNSSRGGARPGAGRKPSPIGSTVRRVPDPLIPTLDALVERFRQAQELPPAAIQFTPSPSQRELPLYGEAVPMGFPSPAQGYIEKYLDLNEFLVSNPPATFFLATEGDSLKDLGIFAGDILVVDRSIEPRHKHLVIAAVDGEFTAKILYRRGDVCELRPANAANPEYRPIPFPQGEDDRIVGVVKWVIKKCSP
jgi:DNA polymerase V